jgi:hypothetical protein
VRKASRDGRVSSGCRRVDSAFGGVVLDLTAMQGIIEIDAASGGGCGSTFGPDLETELLNDAP